jgi:alpha-glucosidase
MMDIFSRLVLIFGLLKAQSPLVSADSPTTTPRTQFTLPNSATLGLNLIPNVDDPLAVDAQTVCPGYSASNVQQDKNGFTASLSLAGAPCNVYGTDIDELSLSVQFQSENRVAINITPAQIVSTSVEKIEIESQSTGYTTIS